MKLNFEDRMLAAEMLESVIEDPERACHLIVGLRRQRDELVEAARELVRQHMNVRAAEGYPTNHSEATIAVDKIIARIEQEDAK